MNATRKAVEFLPALMSVLTIVSMLFFLEVDALVHQKLYSFGLQFSYEWANPYWTTSRTILALGWLTATLGFAVSIFMATHKPEKELDRQWSIHKLRDGSTIRVKHVLRSVRQLPDYASDGAPTYSGTADCIVQVVDFPENLRRKPEEDHPNPPF